MNTTAIASLATSTLTAFGNQVLIVLTAVIGVAIAYFLFKFAWRKIKGSVSDGMFNKAQKHFGYKLNREHYFRNTHLK